MMFEERLREKTEWIERMLGNYLPETDGLQKSVCEAVNYSVLAGGKRLRPLMIFETNLLCGGAGYEDGLVCAFAAAMEMIHTYSLVHDDLPAMDNDRYRRGKLTTHAKYGEAMGILAGDALLNLAFETVGKALAAEKDAKRLAAGAGALAVLAGKAGIYGMLGGQVVDVERTGCPLTEEELEFIYRLKTGALLEASMQVGAILADADEEKLRALEHCAAYVGRAFQIQDDILDVTSNLETLGKPVHSDEKNAKTTYVTLHSLEEAGSEVERLSGQALAELARVPGDREFMEQLIRALIHRTK